MILHVVTAHPRLDAYISQELAVSREKVKTFFKIGQVTLNSIRAKPALSVNPGDSIEIDVPEEVKLDPVFIKHIEIVFEDDSLLVINKAKGDLVHAGEGPVCDTVVEYLRRNGYPLASEAGLHREGIVHRLDRFTEGLMVIAKTNDAYHYLKKQFQDRLIVKKYYAVLHGNLTHNEGEISMPILRHPSKRHLMHVSKEGKAAVTRYRVLKRFNTKTVVDIQILTGRTHQIRVHFAFIGHPVFKDPDYGPDPKAEGQCLQSYYLVFSHPITRASMVFSRPSTI